MISQDRLYTPVKLTPDFVAEKTNEFKQTGASVWNIDWLKEALRGLSHDKCAYCECSVKKESNYMEVEHFEDKSHNPDKVMVWDNLLPSCKHCNGHKSTHDVVKEPIVNPFIDDPRDHLYIQNYRYKSKDEKGWFTKEVLQLNDEERDLPGIRFEIGNALEKLIEQLGDKYKSYKINGSVINRNKMLSTLADMLRQCQPDSEYAALCSTVLHSNDEYLQIKTNLINEGLWDEDYDRMDRVSRTLCLFK